MIALFFSELCTMYSEPVFDMSKKPLSDSKKDRNPFKTKDKMNTTDQLTFMRIFFFFFFLVAG